MYGAGKSLSDMCFSQDGTQLVTRNLRGITSFDKNSGFLTCFAGTTLGEIIDHVLPHGWFIATPPSTRSITVGGAIANDVHGRDHVKHGSFGNHVQSIDLMTSGGHMTCSDSHNTDLFRATIGGLGLTGMIVESTLRLRRIPSAYLRYSCQVFRSFDEAISLLYENNYDYQTLWFDGLHQRNFENGFAMLHNHVEHSSGFQRQSVGAPFRLPFRMPRVIVNQVSMRLANLGYLKMQARKPEGIDTIDDALYTMDKIANYTQIYPTGMLQFQFSVPEHSVSEVRRLLDQLKKSKILPFFMIAKRFGPIPAKGMLSFPTPGLTFALDFCRRDFEPIHTEMTSIVQGFGGRIYMAKDMLVNADAFHNMYPVREFLPYVDPKIGAKGQRRLKLNRNGAE